MHTSRRFVLLAVLAATVVVVPASAEAQLGGFIRKKIENRVADKVLGESASDRRAPAPKFDETVLEITDSHLDGLFRGLAAEEKAYATATAAAAAAKQQGEARRATYEAERKAYEAASAEYQRKAEEVSKCQMAVVGRAASTAMADPAAQKMAAALMRLPEAERDAYQARVDARQEKMRAAQDRGDQATAMKLMDEMDADMQKTLGVSMAELRQSSLQRGTTAANIVADNQKCGELPPEPVEPQDPTAVQVSVRDSIRTAAFAASGMTGEQYSIMRERIAAWYAAKEKKRSSLGNYGFTDAELAVLEQRHAELQARESILLAKGDEQGWSF